MSAPAGAPRRAAELERVERLVAALAASLGPTVTLQTHLSWVVLAGDDAWKIKKPVNFDFVDFSTLALRQCACEEELRLNRRYSPEIYLAVVPIVGSVDSPRLLLSRDPRPGSALSAEDEDGACRPIEFAVHMRRFDQRTIFSRMIAAGDLSSVLIDELAEHIAGLHLAAPGICTDPRPKDTGASSENQIAADAGSADVVRDQCLQALDGVAALIGEARVAPTRVRLLDALDDSATALESRRRLGFVRECHADLHLSNICVHQGKVAVFDCLEFDPLLRQIDVMADLAFIIADCEAWHRPELGWRLLDRYLTVTGDHAGLRVLGLYVGYRALVRARVGLLAAGQAAASTAIRGPGEATRDAPSVGDYLAVGHASLAPHCPTLSIVHGLSGSGKSTIAGHLCARLPLIWLRSDIERKRLLGLAPLERTGSAPDRGAYAAVVSRDTYGQLATRAAQAVEGGFSVIVDATFLRSADRRRFGELAKSLGAAFLIISVEAPLEVMRERVVRRAASGSDPSEAGEAVLMAQMSAAEPLDPAEQALGIALDNAVERSGDDLEAALAPIVARLALRPDRCPGP